MKNHLAIITTVIALATTPAFAETVHIGVDGLVCAFCVKGIEESFNKQPETKSIDVNLEDKLVVLVTKDGTTIKDEVITKLITDAGYKVTNIHHEK
jgi:copper chaperone CopZ